MAKQVNEMPAGRGSRYNNLPWEQWLNGEVWLLDEDDLPTGGAWSTLFAMGHREAGARNLKLQTRKRDEGTYVRAVPRGPGESRKRRAKSTTEGGTRRRTTSDQPSPQVGIAIVNDEADYDDATDATDDTAPEQAHIAAASDEQPF